MKIKEKEHKTEKLPMTGCALRKRIKRKKKYIW